MGRMRNIIASVRAGTNVKDYSNVDTTEYVVRFKDIYLVVDEMSDGNYSVSWMRSPMGHVKIRDYWLATPPKEDREVES